MQPSQSWLALTGRFQEGLEGAEPRKVDLIDSQHPARQGRVVFWAESESTWPSPSMAWKIWEFRNFSVWFKETMLTQGLVASRLQKGFKITRAQAAPQVPKIWGSRVFCVCEHGERVYVCVCDVCRCVVCVSVWYVWMCTVMCECWWGGAEMAVSFSNLGPSLPYRLFKVLTF
jgi:hypothetical protein